MKLALRSPPCLTWAAKPHCKVSTPLPSWSKTSGSMTLLGSPLTFVIHLKNWGKHTCFRYIWSRGVIHEEESSLHPLELNLELQLQHDANQGASHVSSMSNAHHSYCCCHNERVPPHLYCISKWRTVNNLYKEHPIRRQCPLTEHRRGTQYKSSYRGWGAKEWEKNQCQEFIERTVHKFSWQREIGLVHASEVWKENAW